jgi:type I restriction enzyme R subunit
LYESPFTDVSPRGPEGLFTEAQVAALIDVLEEVQTRATAA